jgi:uncharacterized protein (TIGR02996 family)
MNNQAFIRAIRENPGDDGVRLVYADWLKEQGNPLGDFVRTQCEIARLRDPVLVNRLNKRWPGRRLFPYSFRFRPDFDATFRRSDWATMRPARNLRFADLKYQEQRLLAAHEQTWVGPLFEQIQDWSKKRLFHRGFVEFVRLAATDFLRHAAALFDHCPLLRSLQVEGSGPETLPALLASPDMARLEVLDITMYSWFTPGAYSDLELAALANSSLLSGLRALRMGDGMSEGRILTDATLRMLANAPWMPKLEQLILEWDLNGQSPAEARQREDEVNTILGRPICVVVRGLGNSQLAWVALRKSEGYTNEEIARKLDLNVRSVKRKLNLIRQIWDGVLMR